MGSSHGDSTEHLNARTNLPMDQGGNAALPHERHRKLARPSGVAVGEVGGCGGAGLWREGGSTGPWDGLGRGGGGFT